MRRHDGERDDDLDGGDRPRRLGERRREQTNERLGEARALGDDRPGTARASPRRVGSAASKGDFNCSVRRSVSVACLISFSFEARCDTSSVPGARRCATIVPGKTRAAHDRWEVLALRLLRRPHWHCNVGGRDAQHGLR